LPTRYRVLHLINGEFYAGAERVQDLLAQRLPDLGFDIGFACLKDGVFAAERSSQNVPLFRFPMRSRLDFSQVREIADRIKRDDYRLIHTHTPRAALAGRMVSYLARVPMVHHVHSPSMSDTEQGWRNLRNSMVERFSLGAACKLIPVSESLVGYLRMQGYESDRIRLVPNGVAVQPLRRMPYRPGTPLVLGMVALLRPRKGIEVLLQALAQLRAQNQDVSLHVVGPFETSAYEREVMRLVKKLGLLDCVSWTGFTSDVAAQFAHMHVFVLPSLFGEGMPMVVLEAMAAGLPVVGSRVEGIPEVVRDGRDGLLVPPGDPETIAVAINKFISGDLSIAALGDMGRARQRELFSDIAMAEKVAAVYREVLN
jgi:glycosyltransferase involved in cell wall biosynthesis